MEFQDRAVGFAIGRFALSIAHRLCRHALNADTRISTRSKELSMYRTARFKKLNLVGPENVGENVGEKVASRYNAINNLIRENPFITAVQLSEKLSVTDRTIERDLAKLQTVKLLIREGADNGGRWIIIDKN